MRRPTDETSNLHRNTQRAMAARLRREGFAAHEEGDARLQQRIMDAIDSEPVPRPVAASAPAPGRGRATWLAVALTVAAAVVIVAGYGLRQELHPPKLVQQPVETAGDVFAAPAVAMESLTELQASIDPLDELSHDAQLAGQMALSTLPMSASGTD